MRLQQTIQALAALTLLTAGTAANAQQPQEGDGALFLSNISTQPTYNAGYFLSEDILGYGSLAYSSDDNDSGALFGLGARIYGAPGTSEDISTYFNASFTRVGTGYQATGANGLQGGQQNQDAFNLSGDFGAELHLSPRATLGAQVGMDYTDTDNNSVISFGSAALLLNYYF